MSNKIPSTKGVAKDEKACDSKFNFDPESKDPVELLKLYKNLDSKPVFTEKPNMLKKPLIQTFLMIRTWIWEKEQSHRLFNFHEGYRPIPKLERLVGSCKFIYMFLTTGLIQILSEKKGKLKSNTNELQHTFHPPSQPHRISVS